MKWTMFFILCIGLAYCVLMIIYKTALIIGFYREYNFVSRAFNTQYKALRPFLKEDLTAKQIYIALKNDPNTRNLIFNKSKICILMSRRQGVYCNNTAKIRENLIRVACMIEEMSAESKKQEIIITKHIYFENSQLFEELKKICEEKGEKTHYDVREMR